MKEAPVFLRALHQAVLALVLLGSAITMEARGLPSQGPVVAYECDNLATVAARQLGERLQVWGTGFGPLVLAQIGAEPATYADDTLAVTMTAEYLRITGRLGNTVCRSDPQEAPWQDAKLRGIEFRATGTHPDDWVLEYDEGIALIFVAGRGKLPLVAIPRRVVANDSDRMTIEASDGVRYVRVTVERSVCTGPSGVTTAKVTVTIGDDKVGGCGRVLLPGKLRKTVN